MIHTDIVEDLKQTVLTMHAHYGFDVIEMHAGKNYSDALRTALVERGVTLEDAEPGDEIKLSFTSGHKVRIVIH